jgi:hypothetical protein
MAAKSPHIGTPSNLSKQQNNWADLYQDEPLTNPRKKNKNGHYDREFVSTASVYPNKINTYVRPMDGFQHGSSHRMNQAHLLDNRHEGIMSKKARKQIESGINILMLKS